jgi:uncharacterized membrane-anchored protein YitT (DUF2179 family)
VKRISFGGDDAKRLVYFFLSNFLYALALNLFLVKNQIAAGGFSGIATVIHSVIPIPIGTMVMIMNIPFFLFSFPIKGKEFTIKTFFGAFLYSALVDMTAFLPTLTYNKLLASFFGGFLYGIGVIFAVMANSSAGGTDLVNRLLVAKIKSASVGKMMLLVDGLVALLAIIVYKNVEAGLYAIFTIYVCSMITDKGLAGLDYASMCFIVTHRPPDEVAVPIMERLARGVTNIPAVGMFMGEERNILMVAVKPRETYRVKEIVSEVDDRAFMIVAHANEVLGNGFKDLVAGRHSVLPLSVETTFHSNLKSRPEVK